MPLTLHELLYSYEVDSNATLTNYADWLKHPSNPTYHYQLANKYFDNGDWANFVLVRDSIPLKLQLNERQTAYHNSFTALYAQLHNWQQSSISLFEPDSLRKLWLLNFANTNVEYPARIHALLAVNDTFINQPNVYIPNETDGNAPSMVLSIETLEQENEESQINFYPNPAKDFITLEWKIDAKPAFISVTDLQGKTIAQQNWDVKEKCNLVTENWPNGIYFVRVFTSENNSTIIRKVLINK